MTPKSKKLDNIWKYFCQILVTHNQAIKKPSYLYLHLYVKFWAHLDEIFPV